MHYNYLENEILSATPQKLRLMLVDGAMRFARQALDHWRSAAAGEAEHALGRCRAIVMELIASVRTDRQACEFIVDHAASRARSSIDERQHEIDSLHKLSRNTAAIYLIVLRELNEAVLHDEPARVEAAIRVLLVERETLQLVCEQLPDASQLAARERPAEITSSQAATLLSSHAGTGLSGPLVYGEPSRPQGSLSFDA